MRDLHDDLQRYFDGGLDERERSRVEAALTDEDRIRLASLAEMRGLMKDALAAEAAPVDLWAGVAGALGKPRSVASAKRQAVRRWRDRAGGLRFAGTGAGLLVAAAATLVFFLKPWSGTNHLPSNNVEIQSLELDGLTASVLTIDAHRSGDSTTVLFTTEED